MKLSKPERLIVGLQKRRASDLLILCQLRWPLSLALDVNLVAVLPGRLIGAAFAVVVVADFSAFANKQGLVYILLCYTRA